MRILAINSSPRPGGQSKTELMLKHLTDGMRAAGGDVDIVHLRKKTIKKLHRLLHMLDQDTPAPASTKTI